MIGIVDGIVGAICLLSGLWGLVRGGVREIMTSVGWFAAFVLTFKLTPWIKQNLPQGWHEGWPLWGTLAAFFLVSLFLLLWSAEALSLRMRRSVLSGLDRVLGLGFGGMRGLAFACVAYTVLVGMSRGDIPEWIKQARVLPVLRAGEETIKAYFPFENVLFWIQEIGGKSVEEETLDLLQEE